MNMHILYCMHEDIKKLRSRDSYSVFVQVELQRLIVATENEAVRCICRL
jgi:hypothetical protein